MDMQSKDLDADDRAPEIARQEGDVEERSRRETEEHRRAAVEDKETERVAR